MDLNNKSETVAGHVVVTMLLDETTEVYEITQAGKCVSHFM